MAEPSKHHFVSRCYLKAFGFGNKSNRRVRMIDLSRGVEANAHITDVAQSDHFNRLELNGQSPVELEHLLAGIEREAAPALDKLRKTRKLDHRGFDAAICFMAMFAARSPFVRKTLTEKLEQQGTSQLDEFLLNKSNWEALNTGYPWEQVQKDVEQLKQSAKPSRRLVFSAELMFSITLTSSLKNRYWTLLDATGSGNEFVTSDRPVSIVDVSGKSLNGDVLSKRPAFDATDTLVHFPVSPSLALQGAFQDIEHESVDAKLVAGFNSIVAKQAGSQIYHQKKCFKILDDQCGMQENSWVLQNCNASRHNS